MAKTAESIASQYMFGEEHRLTELLLMAEFETEEEYGTFKQRLIEELVAAHERKSSAVELPIKDSFLRIEKYEPNDIPLLSAEKQHKGTWSMLELHLSIREANSPNEFKNLPIMDFFQYLQFRTSLIDIKEGFPHTEEQVYPLEANGLLDGVREYRILEGQLQNKW